VRPSVAIVYNKPKPSRYEAMGEQVAVDSILSVVTAVRRALVQLGYPVLRVPLTPPLERAREKLRQVEAGLVFNLFEGFDGRPETEAAVAEFFSEFGLKHTGCPAAALLLALDKPRAKTLMEAGGVRTPRYQLLTRESLRAFELRLPCIVKPCAEDASHGLTEESVVNDRASLEVQVGRVCDHYGGTALVEEYVDGREFNVTVLGSTDLVLLPVAEMTYSLPPGMPRILTFAAKWVSESSYYKCTKAVCPTDIEPELRERIGQAAMTVYRLMGCSGYARVDFRMDGEGQLHVLELNPNPDISPGMGAARQAHVAGMTYRDFIERIVLFALGSRDHGIEHQADDQRG